MVAYNRPLRAFQDGLALDANDFNAFRADLLSDITRLVGNLVGPGGGPSFGSSTVDSTGITADTNMTADAA